MDPIRGRVHRIPEITRITVKKRLLRALVCNLEGTFTKILMIKMILQFHKLYNLDVSSCSLKVNQCIITEKQ